MKKLLPIALLSTLLFTGCSLQKNNAGIDIKSSPQSKVFINDKEVGNTPYVNKQMAPGEYLVKLVSDNGQWTSNKIRIVENTLFTINRELAANADEQSGENVSLEKGKGIAVFSDPPQADISMDGQFQDKSPYLIAAADKGVHEITLSKDGYVSRTIKVKTIDGYKVFIEAQLKKATSGVTTSPSPTPVASASASPSTSSKASPTPKATTTTKPTATPKASASAAASAQPSATPSGKTVTINSPDTGWLRVRSKPGPDGEEITKVNNGEVFEFTQQLDTGWTEIVLTDGTKGYVASKYVKVNK